MNLRYSIIILLTAIQSIAFSAESNITIKGHVQTDNKKFLAYFYKNTFSTHHHSYAFDSVFVENGSFTWNGNLQGKVRLTISAPAVVKSPISFFIAPGNYEVYIDSTQRFLKDPLSGEKNYYKSYSLRPNDKLIIENQYQELIDKLSELDSNVTLKTEIAYRKQKQLMLDFIASGNAPISFFAIRTIGRTHSKLFSAGELIAMFENADAAFQESEDGKFQLDMLQKETLTDIVKSMDDISALTPDSNTFSIKELNGKYVLIDFWASWCKPCRAENPLLRDMYAQYRDKGLEIVSFSLDDKHGKWVDAIAKDSMNWIHLSDLNGWKNKDGVDDKYGIRQIPTNILIDPNGMIIDKYLHGMFLEKRLKELLN